MLRDSYSLKQDGDFRDLFSPRTRLAIDVPEFDKMVPKFVYYKGW